VIAYFIIVKNILWQMVGIVFPRRKQMKTATLETVPHIVADRDDFIHAHNAAKDVRESRTIEAPLNLPTSDIFAPAPVMPMMSLIASVNALKESLENRAHADEVLMSPEVIETIVSRAGGKEGEAFDLLETVLAKAKMDYPREDGWILINHSRLQSILDLDDAPQHYPTVLSVPRQSPNPHVDAIAARYAAATALVQPEEEMEVVETPEASFGFGAVAPELAPVAANEASVETNVSAPVDRSTDASVTQNAAPIHPSVGHFIVALVEGKEEEAFKMLRSIGAKGTSHSFILDAIRAVDDVHKNRIEGNRAVDLTVAEKTSSLSTSELENLLTILIDAVDHTYSSDMIAFRLMVARAIAFFDQKNAALD
jgi:hypothetical protein